MIHKCNASFNLVITGLENELHRNFPLCSENGGNLWFADLEISSALSKNNVWLLLLIKLFSDRRRAGERKESWLLRACGPRVNTELLSRLSHASGLDTSHTLVFSHQKLPSLYSSLFSVSPFLLDIRYNMPGKIFEASFKTAEQIHLKHSKAFSQSYTPGMEKCHPACWVYRKLLIVSGGISWKHLSHSTPSAFPEMTEPVTGFAFCLGSL